MKKTTRDVNGKKKPDPGDPFSDLNPEALWAQIGIDIPRQRAERDEVRNRESRTGRSPAERPGIGIRDKEGGVRPQVPPAGQPITGDAHPGEQAGRLAQASSRKIAAGQTEGRDNAAITVPAAPPVTPSPLRKDARIDANLDRPMTRVRVGASSPGIPKSERPRSRDLQSPTALPAALQALAPAEDSGPVVAVSPPATLIPVRKDEQAKPADDEKAGIFREEAPGRETPPDKDLVQEERETLRKLSLGGFLQKKGIRFNGKPVEAAPPVPAGRNTQGQETGVPAMPNGLTGRMVSLIRSGPLAPIMNRIMPPPKVIASIHFDPGPLSQPNFEGHIRSTSLTYAVDPPYQFVHIEFSPTEGALVYSVIEPGLSVDEKQAMALVEKSFGKMIVSNAQVITPAAREVYLRDRYLTILKIFDLRLSEEQKERIFFHLRRKYLGYGRLDSLMKDRYIEDISCNGPGMYLYILHRIYGSIRTDVIYDEVELNNFVLRLAQMAGRHISLLQPIRDLSLPDGNRANITLGSEVTKKGSTFTIRKFRSNPISPVELVEYGTIDPAQLAYLWILMEYKRSILVSGGTATGKTTLLNVLCSFIPPEFKIVSIEDTAELNLMHPNWIQSVSRSGFGGESSTSSLSGVSGMTSRTPGDISLYDLLVAALRQRPEFIIVGEVRGTEAFTLFQAIAVGHAALGTIHAGSMDELLARVESNPMNVPRSLIANLDAVIFAMYLKQGERNVRRIINIVEVLELDRETKEIVTNTAFKWIPETDTFQFQGRSFLFDKIRETYGVEQDLLTRELVDRANLISWMKRKGIREYGEVTELIRTYYRDKGRVEALINSDLSEKLGI
ncbi:MAG TPA: ATPase, T2SS/T4P/T4SS family [Methanomicrobiales archaeon]|nr:ATPase, T2SS/T4P/T4SS family [Methanomicrobiales archaeon]